MSLAGSSPVGLPPAHEVAGAIDAALNGLGDRRVRRLRVPAASWETLRRARGVERPAAFLKHRGVTITPGAGTEIEVELAPSALQQFVSTRPGVAEALYLVPRDGVHFDEQGLRVQGPARVSFDAYFNSFDEACWLEHTVVRSVGLGIGGAGRLRCRLIRETEQGRETAADVLVDLAKDGDTEVWAQPPGRLAGRLFAELEIDCGPVQIERLTWASREPPLREVSLGIGLCTFNREQSIVAILEEVLRGPAAAVVSDVSLVNQGLPLTSRRFQEIVALETQRLRVIEQPNHGGSGGFARAAMDLLERGRCTHVVLLDDDVELDGRQLVTAASFLRFASAPVVVGGQMLDLHEPTTLFEAGARILAGRVLPNHREIDLASCAGRTALSGPRPVDFNGWWLDVLPVDVFREHGLPLPFFIHVDDVEYGVRLTEAGVPTVSLAPVSVWHERYSAKPPAIYSYYDVRNWAIFAALYPHRYAPESPVALAKRLLGLLLRYDYLYLRLMNMALRDFLAGPAVLDQPALATHARVQRVLSEAAPAMLDRRPDVPMARADVPARAVFRSLRVFEASLRVLVGAPAREPRAGESLVSPEMPLVLMRLGRSYVLTDGKDHYFVRREYSLASTWRELFSTLSTIARYAVTAQAAARRWRASHLRLASREAWIARLSGTNEDVAAGSVVTPEHARPVA